MNVDEMLKDLQPPADWTVDSTRALRKLRTAAMPPSRPRAWYRAVAAAAVLGVLLVLPATRSGAQWLWRILHVQQVVVLQAPLDLASVLGAKVISAPGTPTDAASLSDAERQVGFVLKLPRAGTLSSQPRYWVVTPGALYEQVLYRPKFQAAIESLHRTDLIVPPAAEGARIRMGISAGAVAGYGQCDGFACDVTLSQAMAPEIAVSDGVDLGEWMGFFLQLAGVDKAEALRNAAGMKNALPIVLLAPPASAVLGEVKVGGVPAVRTQTKAADATPTNSLLWIAGGRLYSLSVRGSAEFALAVANSVE